MKLKCIPQDFRVEEVAGPLPEGGDYALYHLTKEGLGTPEAVDAVCRRWKIPRRAVAYGGLKDRHAVTIQSLTIHRGPRRDLRQTNLSLIYRGQVGRAFTSEDIRANRFDLVARNLTHGAATRAEEALAETAVAGVPNYFDDQRFGSLGQSGEFIAQAWCREDYERALWLALADPHAHDRSRTKSARRFLREHWGDWSRCAASRPCAEFRDVLKHLAAHPGDFEGAITCISREMRSLYLAAFQSRLWNGMLAELLRDRVASADRTNVALAGGSFPFHLRLDSEVAAELFGTEIPLPSARLGADAGPWQPILDRVLAPFGLTLPEIRIRRLRESFFSKGDRRALLAPSDVRSEEAADDMHPGRRKLRVQFELPRGSYATIVLKRLALP